MDGTAPTLAGFVLVCLAVELTPGPNMAYLAVLGAERGRLAGLAAVAGVALGLAALGLLAVAGLGAVLSAQPLLYEALRWAGIAYLVYLAWDSWASSRRPPEAQDLASGAGRYLLRGLVNNLLNPKAALFFVTVLPGFVAPGAPVVAETIRLGAVYVLVATLVHAAVVLLAGAARPFVADPRRRRQMGWVFAALLLAVAAWLGIATAR